MSTGDSDEEISEGVPEPCNRSRDSVDGRPRDRSSSLRPALYTPTSGQHPVEAVNQLAKSVSTPHIAGENGNNENGTTEEFVNTSNKSP